MFALAFLDLLLLFVSLSAQGSLLLFVSVVGFLMSTRGPLLLFFIVKAGFDSALFCGEICEYAFCE
jgi:hypothetical protein